MFAMLLWSFHLDKDFTPRYETETFRKHFWNVFVAGRSACLLGCFGFGATIKSRAAMRTGILAFASGLALTILLVPFVGFDNWTFASADMLIGTVFAGAILLFTVGGLQWLWQKFSTSTRLRHS
jgi:hypothetical protein